MVHRTYWQDIAQRNADGVYAVLLPGVRQSSTSPIATTSSRLARNPPWLMMPVALAIRSDGLDVRPRSKPIIEAGPPIPTITTSSTRSHSGAGPRQVSTTVQITTIDDTMLSTNVDRCHGCR